MSSLLVLRLHLRLGLIVQINVMYDNQAKTCEQSNIGDFVQPNGYIIS